MKTRIHGKTEKRENQMGAQHDTSFPIFSQNAPQRAYHSLCEIEQKIKILLKNIKRKKRFKPTVFGESVQIIGIPGQQLNHMGPLDLLRHPFVQQVDVGRQIVVIGLVRIIRRLNFERILIWE